jgi:DHA1 family multidrug resistance protein-like MFS transporter
MEDSGSVKRSVMRDVLSIYIPSFFNTIGMSIVSPILPIYSKSFGVSYAVASLAISVYALGRLLADIPVGAAADRWGRRPMMFAGTLIITAMALANANAPNFSWFLVFRFLQGVGSSMWMTTRQTLLADILRPEERGRIMGYFQAFMLIGQSAGPTIGGWVASVYGLAAPFYFYAATGLITTVLTFFLIFEPKGVVHRGGGAHSFSFGDAFRLLRNSTYAMACLATFTVFFQRSGIRTNMVPLFGANVLGLDEAAIGTVISYSTLANLLLTVPMGYAIDLLGRKPVIAFNMIIMAVADVAFVFAGDYWGMSIAAVVLGIASAGAGQAPLALATDASYNERRGLAMGVYRLIGDIGSMIGPILLSAIADYSDLRTPFYIMAGILVFNSLMVAVFAKEVISTRLGKGTGLGGPAAGASAGSIDGGEPPRSPDQ